MIYANLPDGKSTGRKIQTGVQEADKLRYSKKHKRNKVGWASNT